MEKQPEKLKPEISREDDINTHKQKQRPGQLAETESRANSDMEKKFKIQNV